jgi:hypothetical protein
MATLQLTNWRQIQVGNKESEKLSQLKSMGSLVSHQTPAKVSGKKVGTTSAM